MDKKHILIGSPVYQKPEILKEFLEALLCLKQDNVILDYFFYDDNTDIESKKLLKDFAASAGKTTIRDAQNLSSYDCNEHTHYWNESLSWKVASFKDEMISYTLENVYDYLFLVDSDLLPEPSTIDQLVTANKDIISEVFWTRWQPGAPFLPNVWLFDHYDMIPRKIDEKLTPEESSERLQQFIDKLKEPGVYEVGMLGACTLLSRKAMLAGISFKPVYNLSMWGEDRHFCIRAAALGFRMYADTHCKVFHIYRESDLNAAAAFKKEIGISVPPITFNLYHDKVCPVCNSDNITGFHDYTSFKLLKCNSCGLKFQTDIRSENVGRLISETYGPSWIQMRDQYRIDTFLGHAKFNNMLLEMLRPAKGKLLEIGSGTGEFLYMAKEAGWEVTGIEASSDACSYAAEKFGLELKCEMWNPIEKAKNMKKSEGYTDTKSQCQIENSSPLFKDFDAVVFWHVIEHAPDPITFLISAANSLKPDGLLFFSFPNDDCFSNEFYGYASPLYLEIDHLIHYNKRNISILLEKSGLEPVILFSRQELQGLDKICNALNGGTDVAFEKLIGTSAKLQSQSRGYELVCVAQKKSKNISN